MSLTFDEAKHEYRWKGERVVNVTTVINDCYDFRFVKPEHMERARLLGSAVDKTVRLSEASKLNEAATDPMLLRHLKQWREFKAECQFNVVEMGYPLYSTRFGYAGSKDVHGRISDEQSEMLLDIKTGGEYHSPHALQTAAYKQLGIENGKLGEQCRRASLYLDEKSYALRFHTDANDLIDFLAYLRIYRRNQRYGK